jgi:hypothetical protein
LEIIYSGKIRASNNFVDLKDNQFCSKYFQRRKKSQTNQKRKILKTFTLTENVFFGKLAKKIDSSIISVINAKSFF